MVLQGTRYYYWLLMFFGRLETDLLRGETSYVKLFGSVPQESRGHRTTLISRLSRPFWYNFM